MTDYYSRFRPLPSFAFDYTGKSIAKVLKEGN